MGSITWRWGDTGVFGGENDGRCGFCFGFYTLNFFNTRLFLSWQRFWFLVKMQDRDRKRIGVGKKEKGKADVAERDI